MAEQVVQILVFYANTFIFNLANNLRVQLLNSPYVCVPKNQEESLTSLSQFKNKGNGKHCQTIGLFRYEHLYRTGHAFEELESDGTRRGHVLQDVLAGSGRKDPVRIFKEEFSRGQLFLSLIHISEPTRRTPISYAV